MRFQVGDIVKRSKEHIKFMIHKYSHQNKDFDVVGEVQAWSSFGTDRVKVLWNDGHTSNPREKMLRLYRRNK